MKLTQAQYDDLIAVLADALEAKNRGRTLEVIGRRGTGTLEAVWVKLAQRQGVEVEVDYA